MTVHRPVSRLQAARRAAGWSQARLLHEMVRAAGVLGVTLQNPASLKVSISRWENGKRSPGPTYRRLLRAVYGMSDAELGLQTATGAGPLPVAGGAMAAAGSASGFWAADAAGDVEEWAFDTGEFMTAAVRWLVAGNSEPTGSGRMAVGDAHVDAVRQMTASMRAIDNQYGGGYARGSVLRFLHHEVTPLVRDGRYGSQTGVALFSAAAEMTQLVGWMTYDVGQYGMAGRYLVHALRLAAAGGDRRLGAEILAAMSHESTWLGHGGAGVDVAQAARHTAQRAGSAALVAEAAVLEAHGYAQQGEERACTVALARAELYLDRADPKSEPGWISYFDEAYLSAKFGHCFRELRRPRQSQRFAERSLCMDESYVRGKTFNLALLATAHAQQGAVEEAVTLGRRALAGAVELQSARAVRYVNILRRELAGYADAPLVAAFERDALVVVS